MIAHPSQNRNQGYQRRPNRHGSHSNASTTQKSAYAVQYVSLDKTSRIQGDAGDLNRVHHGIRFPCIVYLLHIRFLYTSALTHNGEEAQEKSKRDARLSLTI
jgi:hypothetical protein